MIEVIASLVLRLVRGLLLQLRSEREEVVKISGEELSKILVEIVSKLYVLIANINEQLSNRLEVDSQLIKRRKQKVLQTNQWLSAYVIRSDLL